MKRRLTLLLMLLLTLGLHAQPNRPRVAVVLSGGGAKGVAHISALRVIEEAGIPIDIICGTSMGSLIGGLYAIGYSTDFLDSLVRSQDWTSLLSDRTDPSDLTLRQREEQNTYALIRGISSDRPQQGGIIRGRNLNRLFRKLCADYPDSISFDSLPIPFACVATDIVTNTEVVFHSGRLFRAMRASMAIPGVFTPVRMGDSVLVDGGLRNNYPADVARRMGADIIIGVTVQGEPLTADEISDAATVMMQIIDINTKNKYLENIAMSDVMMKVDVSGYSAASFYTSAIDTLLARGDREARSHWDELLTLRRTHGIDSLPRRATRYTPTRPIAAPQKNGFGHTPIASVGFRFDSEEMGAIQLSGKIALPTRLPMGIAGTVRMGRRILARAEYSLLTPYAALNPTISYTFRNNDIDLYTQGLRYYNVRYYQHSADIAPLDIRLHLFDIRAGIRWDYFDYYGQLLSYENRNNQLVDDHYFSYHASADLNTENNWYFPSRGTRFHATYSYRTTDFLGFDGNIGINDISAHWRINLSPTQRLTLQPMLYTRLVLSDTVPWAFSNAVGGEWFGHVVEQQLPLSGLGHMEPAAPCVVAAQLQAQYRILDNHYILLRAATLVEADRLNHILALPSAYSLQMGYSYNTLFGPIDLRLGYNTLSRRPYFLLNIGHIF